MSTTLPAPSGFTAAELVFNDSFSGTTLNTAFWNTYLATPTSGGGPADASAGGGSGDDGIYDDEYFEPSQVSVYNGLTLTAIQQPVLGADYAYGALTPQVYPVTSGAISSDGKFEFEGGYLQISMKAPSGDGAWPGLWLMPGTTAGNVGNNFELDIDEGGYSMEGTANANYVASYALHGPDGTIGNSVVTSTDLTTGFNTYAINWIPGKSITYYLNGQELGEITSAEAPIPDEPMELIMTNQVASSNFYPWHTYLDASTPYSMAMQIADVQLYQAPGSGDTVLGSNVSSTTTSSSSSTSTATRTSTVTTASVAVPSVEITSAGGPVPQASQTISGTVDVADAGTTVKVYDGTTQIGSATAGSNGAWSANVTLATGANVVAAIDANAAGTGVSNTVTFTVEDHPTIAITSVGGAVTQASQTIAGAVDLADAGTLVKVYDGPTLVGLTTVGSNGAWSDNVTLANQGSNAVWATDVNTYWTGVSNVVTYLNQSIASQTSSSSAPLTTSSATLSSQANSLLASPGHA